MRGIIYPFNSRERKIGSIVILYSNSKKGILPSDDPRIIIANYRDGNILSRSQGIDMLGTLNGFESFA